MRLNTKFIAVSVVVIIVIGALYSMFSGGTPTSSTNTAATGAVQQSVGQDLLDLLSKLQTVNFNTDLFTNSTFMSLSDFGITLPIPNLGRPNPFEKIGIDVTSVH